MSVPAKTSTSLANTSKHDTPLLCQARDNSAMSKHDKGYCVKARDILLSQSTTHILGQTNRRCCDQSTGHMLYQSKRHTTVSNHETHYCIKALRRCCETHDRRQTLLLCHSITHQTVRALPSIEHRIHPRTQYPSPEKKALGLRGKGKGGYTSGNVTHFVVPWKAGGLSPLKPARLWPIP